MKKIVSTLLAAVLVMSLAACGSSSDSSSTTAAPETQAAVETENEAVEEEEEIAAEETATVIEPPASPLRWSLGSSSVGGNFYIVGGGLATEINNSLPDYFVVTSEETGGSTANLTMLQDGEIELGISMTSSMAEGWEGEAEWTGGVAMTNLRGVLPLYPSCLTIYALESSNIHSLEDMNGKIVGLGSKGAAMDSVFREALPAMGIEAASFFNDGHAATATAVSDGQVDVALLFSLPPFSAITELEASKDLSFIGLTQEQQDYLTSNYDFYSADVMPAGSYKGVTEDLAVVSEWNMLVTIADVDEDYIYLITKALFEGNDYLVQVYNGLTYAVPENCVNFNVPLHAGTVRYLKEIGMEVPDALIPPEYEEQ